MFYHTDCNNLIPVDKDKSGNLRLLKIIEEWQTNLLYRNVYTKNIEDYPAVGPEMSAFDLFQLEMWQVPNIASDLNKNITMEMLWMELSQDIK